MPELMRTAAPVFVWLALAALMSAVLAASHGRLGRRHRSGPLPIRAGPQTGRWRWTTWGAVGATALWLATSVALFAYVRRLGSYESTYGSLAGVAISMFWLWISVLLVVAGAAVNGEAERQTTRDSPVGLERPMGERGAVVADSVPPFPGEP